MQRRGCGALVEGFWPQLRWAGRGMLRNMQWQQGCAAAMPALHAKRRKVPAWCPTWTPVAEGTPVLNSRITVDTTVSVSWPQKLQRDATTGHRTWGVLVK